MTEQTQFPMLLSSLIQAIESCDISIKPYCQVPIQLTNLSLGLDRMMTFKVGNSLESDVEGNQAASTILEGFSP